MEYKFKTPDYPEAVGKVAKDGDQGFGAYFPTDDGGRVTILMGRAGLVNHLSVLLKMLENDPQLASDVHNEMANVEEAT